MIEDTITLVIKRYRFKNLIHVINYSIFYDIISGN